MLSKEQNNYQHHFDNINFKGKRTGENVILLLRRHWLVFVLRFFPFLLILLGLIIFHFFGKIVFNFLDLKLDLNWFYLIESFLAIFAWLSLFITWINFYLDVWIITDSRIVDINQIALFSRNISELKHNKIQDVTSEVQGIIPTLFDFGDVYIQTAGNKQRFVFKQISNPTNTRNIIMQLQKKAVLEEKREAGEIMRGKA